MSSVGIEAMNLYGGGAYVDVAELCGYRGLEPARFEKLLMREKTLALPFEDPVSFAVNAARPLVDALSEEQRNSIEMVITCTESGIDFGKSLSTYVHDLLGLRPNCRLFEVKQACYSGAVGLQTAVNFILSGTSPGARALVVATDVARFALADPGEIEEWAYSEPTSGSGAVAMLVSAEPHVLQIDPGAYGVHAFEVMDTCRPGPDNEAGDSDLSLMAYLDCCEKSYKDYARRVEGADLRESFGYLAFHTPFGGMVKGAHRHLMRRLYKEKPPAIEADFVRRLEPSLSFGARLGNTAGGSLMIALAGILETADLEGPTRVGMFSYGSGCCSEFFSGVVTPEGQVRSRAQKTGEKLDHRYRLSMEEYEVLLKGEEVVRFGTRDAAPDQDLLPEVWEAFQGKERLVLDRIEGYHRKYRWV